jgi:conjugative transfer region protein TrbK
MDSKALALVGTMIFVGIATTATVIEFNRADDRTENPITVARPTTTRNPLRAELARCGSIGEAGARNPSCLRAWAENRRRFLGQPEPMTSAAPITSQAPATLFPAPPILPSQDEKGSR